MRRQLARTPAIAHTSLRTPASSNLTWYVSGANRPSDIRGLALANVAIGADVSRLSEPAIEAILKSEVPIFLDSGAFREVSVQGGRVVVTHPISSREWERRLSLYLRIARMCEERTPRSISPRVTIVAPDRVGSQAETLKRLSKYKVQLMAIRKAGADIVVPLQIGRLSLREFHNAAAGILNMEIVPGMPMNKAARDIEEILLFLHESKVDRVHLLGIGPKNARMHTLLREVQRLAPSVVLSADSNQIRAAVGQTRPLTRLERENLNFFVEHWSGEVDLRPWEDAAYDMTELLFCPSCWLGDVMDIAQFARSLTWMSEESQQEFSSDPDAFLKSQDADDWLVQSLLTRYIQFIQLRSRRASRSRAVEEIFRPKRSAPLAVERRKGIQVHESAMAPASYQLQAHERGHLHQTLRSRPHQRRH